MEFKQIQDIRKKDEALTKNTPKYNIVLISLIYLLIALNMDVSLPALLASIPLTYIASIPIVNTIIKSINHLSNGYTTSSMEEKERKLVNEVKKCNKEIKYINKKRDSIKNSNVKDNNIIINLNKSNTKVLKRVR